MSIEPKTSLNKKDLLELVPYVWPLAKYKITEFFKRMFGELIKIKSSHGEIIGVKMSSSYGYSYINFFGIPYAKPPVGNLRFKDPQPVDPWTQPLHAMHETAASQNGVVRNRPLGSEDCLHMNIYTKDVNPKVLYPIMVFLHGGAFILGSNSKDVYNPEYFLRKDVVLAVVNYRLGIFGFLSVEDPTFNIPGNAGLKDQVMALKFIKENCERFGGDPNNITLFGESAGGCSVHYHMISDMSKDLFHKAIVMSGTALSAWSTGQLEKVPERVAKCLGWNGKGGLHEAMKELQKASPAKLLAAQNCLIGSDEWRNFIFVPVGPTIEPYRSNQCFIDKDPALMSMDPWSRKIPLLIGGCSNEGLLLCKMVKNDPRTLTDYSENAENIVPIDIFPDRNDNRREQFGQEIKKFYFGITEPSLATLSAYLLMLGDREFWHGIYRTLMSRNNLKDAGPTYLYRFDYSSKRGNLAKLIFAGKNMKEMNGACHFDDCFYLFKTAFNGKWNPTSKEFKIMDRMVSIWTSFATTGNPNVDSIKSNGVWKPMDGEMPFKCLNIADELEVIVMPERERMMIWDAIYGNCRFY